MRRSIFAVACVAVTLAACNGPNSSEPVTALGGEEELSAAQAQMDGRYEPTLEVSVPVPKGWRVYPGYFQGRHRGFDKLLLTSFEVTDGAALAHAPPEGELALHVGFEGNDLGPGQSLRAYVDERLASPFYQPTGNEFLLGGKQWVELEGETGTLWVTSHGPNVYSVFVHGTSGEKLDPRIRAIAAGLQMYRDDPLPIPEGARGLWAGGLKSIEAVQPRALTGDPVLYSYPPSMKLPWASGLSKVYTGGPHGGTSNGCTALLAQGSQSGVDFGLSVGNEVLATAGGTINYSGNAGGTIGNAVGINHGGSYDFSTRYWHLDTIKSGITVGTSVVQGKVLGTSGYPTAPHLHLEFRTAGTNSSYPAHGVVINGKMIRSYIQRSDSKGWNYQGTMTEGSETQVIFNYCGGTSNALKWTAAFTAYAGSGSVTSSNTRVP